MTPEDLIRQYITTGQIIPKYQYDKLSNNEKKSYIKQRLVAAGQHSNYQIKDYEVLGLPPEDGKKIMSSLDKMNAVQMMSSSTNIRELLPYIDTNVIKYFKDRSGAPDFKQLRGSAFLLDALKDQEEPELIINLFTNEEKINFRQKTESDYDIYSDILERTKQPIKIFNAIGLNMFKILEQKNDYYYHNILKNNNNPNDIITLLHPQIRMRQLRMDDPDLARLYISAAHPMEIYKLTRWEIKDLTSDEITYSFAKSDNITELIETYNQMSKIRDFKKYIQYLDFYSMRRILSTVRSLENLNTFITLMGDKMIYSMKDYTNNDWEFVLKYHKVSKPNVYNELLKYQKQYG